MKNKTKKILAGVCLGLVGMGCLSGCSAEELKIPTDYNVSTPTDYNVDIPTDYDVDIPTDFNITTTVTSEKQYRLTVINDSDHGTIYPDLKGDTSSVMVEEGDNYTFTIRAKEGYKLDNLLIDGEFVEAQEIYTFTNIDKDHSIGAIYSKLEEEKIITSLNLVGIDSTVKISDEKSDSNSDEYVLPSGTYSCSITIYQDMSIWDREGGYTVVSNQSLLFTDESDISVGHGKSFGLTWYDDESSNREEILLNNNNEFELGIRCEWEGFNSHRVYKEKISLDDLIQTEQPYHDNVFVLSLDYVLKILYSDEISMLKLENVKLYFTANY